MFTLAIENAKGNRLRLSNNPNYTIVSVTGLNPPKANINTAVNASFDGSTFKSSRLENRNVVITLAIEGAVETNRTELYKFVKAKQDITIYFTNASRDVYIQGYVESLQVDLFENKQLAQISVICPNPYFMNAEETQENFSSIHGLFEFPFSIEEEGISFSEIVVNEEVNIQNLGDVATGMIVEFRATGTVVDPAIYNTETHEFMKLNETMSDGDVIQINTNKGEKGVLKVSDGTVTNILNKLDKTSTWLELETGDNIVLYTATTNPENLACTVYHNYLYEGV